MAAERESTPPPPPGIRRSPRIQNKALPKAAETVEAKTDSKSPKGDVAKKTVSQTSRASKRSREAEEEDELAQDTPVKRVKTPEMKAAPLSKDNESEDTASKDTTVKNTTVKDTTSKDTTVKETIPNDTATKASVSETPNLIASGISRAITTDEPRAALIADAAAAPQATSSATPRKSDKDVATETFKILPALLKTMPNEDHTACQKLTLKSLKPLTKAECPNRSPCKIRVVNEDTIDAALRLNLVKEHNAGHVIVLNMANASKPGAGWLSGALAQEECIFWRTTLSASLQEKYYPIKPDEGLYSPDVAVIRESRGDGHRRYDPSDGWYPLVAVMSVAAKTCPGLKRVPKDGKYVEVFTSEVERERAKYNARLCLRMAARKGHRNLVLGALGCGVFSNPRHDTAECWKEVFAEDEFSGGWWDSVEFAVLDRPRGVNITVYKEILEGLEV